MTCFLSSASRSSEGGTASTTGDFGSVSPGCRLGPRRGVGDDTGTKVPAEWPCEAGPSEAQPDVPEDAAGAAGPDPGASPGDARLDFTRLASATDPSGAPATTPDASGAALRFAGGDAALSTLAAAAGLEAAGRACSGMGRGREVSGNNRPTASTCNVEAVHALRGPCPVTRGRAHVDAAWSKVLTLGGGGWHGVLRCWSCGARLAARLLSFGPRFCCIGMRGLQVLLVLLAGAGGSEGGGLAEPGRRGPDIGRLFRVVHAGACSQLPATHAGQDCGDRA